MENMKLYNRKNLQNAKNLRKQMTPWERHLWYDFLKNLPIHIYRQKPIDNYILDFYCAKAKLAIELDGSGHSTKSATEHDSVRTMKLNKLGIKAIRYFNNDIDTHFEAVCEDIYKEISQRIKKL